MGALRDQTALNIREWGGRRKQKSLEQHEWKPQREDHRGDDHVHEVHRAEGLALNVSNAKEEAYAGRRASSRRLRQLSDRRPMCLRGGNRPQILVQK